MSGLTPSELGVIFIALFAVFYWKGILATFTAVIGLVGVVLLGQAGWIGRTLAAAATWMQHFFGTVTTDAFGATFAGVLTVVLGAIYIHGLLPRNATGKHHQWIGIALGALIVAGVTGIPALSGARAAITSMAQSIVSLV